MVEELKDIHDLGVEIAIVVGGGNIWRGTIGEEMGMERSQADYMGMLATVMNALALQDVLENSRRPNTCTNFSRDASNRRALYSSSCNSSS